MSNEVTGLDWSADLLLPIFQAPEKLEIYDARGASHDSQLAIATLVGLINRPQPRVYLNLGDDEVFWLKQCLSSVPQQIMPATKDGVLDALLTTYRECVKGTIIYDPNLEDTVNIATMLAGLRDGVVVSPDLAQSLQHAHNLPILVDLRTHQWSSRLQAYHWAQENLLGECSAHMVAGLGPGTTMGVRAFLVATRTFIYWLDSRNRLPHLGEDLLSERSLMRAILRSFQPGTVHLGWFIDESSGVNLTTQAAISVLATDLFSNLEVWTAVRAKASPEPVPTAQEVVAPAAANKVYVSFTISDGDNFQYCQHRMLRLWRDRERGSVPIGWTISPLLLHSAPTMAEYYMSSATARDELIAGPSGITYMFPSRWPRHHLASFLQQTGKLMQGMHMSTLAVLDTDLWQSIGLPLLSNIRVTGMAFTYEPTQRFYVAELHDFGVRGILSGAGTATARWKKIRDTVVYQNLGLADSVGKTVNLIRKAAERRGERPLFLNVYMLAWTITPADLKKVAEQLGSDYEIVLPKTLLEMLAKVES